LRGQTKIKKGRGEKVNHEAEIRPESDEVAVGEDGVGFGELLIDERHDGLQLRLVLV
jgi:hypothetical protein